MSSGVQARPATGPGARHRVPFRELLERNELGIIDSPFLWISPEVQDENARAIYKTHDLSDSVSEEVFVRGGRLARDEDLFLSRSDVTASERKAIERERTSTLWQQSKELKVILLTCCIAAIAQGWDQASLTGANLRWPDDLHVPVDKNSTSAEWVFGGVNAIAYFSASSAGAWLSDPLNEYFYGRRGALFVAGLFSFVGVVGSAFCHSWQALFGCRFLVGIGMGAKASVVPILESEVAPARIRGRLLVSWQTFTALGIFLGNAANVILNRYWRWQTASAFIPALILLILVFVCSESPRWLIKRGNYRKAFEVLVRLREHQLLAARDLYYVHAQIQVEASLFARHRDADIELQEWAANINRNIYQEEFKRTSYARRFARLFTVSRNRRAAVASLVVMAAQQMSGINIFAFLADSFFSNSASDNQSLWLTFGFGAANFCFSPIAYWFIDSRGRRYLLLMSLLCCFPLLLATGFSFDIGGGDSSKNDSGARTGVVAMFLMLYTMAYSPGAGVVPFLYSSEIWPLLSREVGMSWACFWNFFLAGVLALVVKPLTATRLKHSGTLGLFAGLDAIAFVLVWLLVPGTAEVTTLEEMNYVFGVPTKRHIQYQIYEILPWIWDCVFHRSRAVPPEPLYQWERQQRREVDTGSVDDTS